MDKERAVAEPDFASQAPLTCDQAYFSIDGACKGTPYIQFLNESSARRLAEKQ